MSGFKLKRPSLGTVLGFIALIVAVVGTANASPNRMIVRRGDIAPGAVNAKALAPGAVTSKKLAKGAVTARKVGKGAITAESIASDAVTSAALAPGSVYGGALGEETVHVTPIADLDEAAENGKWTGSNTEVAICGQGEKLLGGGFAINPSGTNEVTFLEDLPSPSGNGVAGQMATNTGGVSKGEIMALCLK